MPDGRMVHDTLSPHQFATQARKRGCYTCVSFLGRFYGGHLVCDRAAPAVQVIGTPALRCAFWEQATGADDE